MNRTPRSAPLSAKEFADRVMTAIRVVPAPTPTGAFVASLRARALRDAVATLSVAWHLGTVRRWSVAPRVRARSFALVLAVASVLASGSLVAAAAVHSVVPQRDDANPVLTPSGSSVDEGPAGNGRTGNPPSQPGEEPTTSESPKPAEHHVVSTGHAPAAPAGGHPPANGSRTDTTDDHRGSGDGNATDGSDVPDASDKGNDGSGDGDHPAATDGHRGPEGPSESDAPDDHPATTGGGSGGDGDGPGNSGEPGTGSDSSGG